MNRKDDKAVEDALLRRACGYDVREETQEETDKGTTKRRITMYHVPGDVRAQIFLLKNRKPGVWKEKSDEQADRAQGVTIVDDVPQGRDSPGVF